MEIQNESGDKKYFTIIPNYIANHSSANDQALYLQMKKITGEGEGVCYASEKYFKDKLQIGSKALKKSIKYLIDHKWIEEAGVKGIKTKGGVQQVKTYLIKDIWDMNIKYYQGVSESEPLKEKQGVSESEGVSESNQRGVQKETKGVAFEQQIRTTNNNNNKIDDLFIKFWKNYPKKVGKPVAERSFKKLKPTESLLEEIIKGINKYKDTDQWQKNNGEFIPNPATFLNQRRWEDQLEADEEIEIPEYAKNFNKI